MRHSQLSVIMLIATGCLGPTPLFAAEPTLESIEAELESLYAKVSPAIVQVNPGSNGVIVSADGYIIHYHFRARPGEPVEVRLQGGRVVSGTSKGWSSEFGIGVAKLDEGGDWPHV